MSASPDVLVPFLLSAFALIGSPGPNTLSLAAVGASFGPRRGIEYMLGLNAGVALVIAITGTGIAGVILAVPGAAPVVTALAAAYFLYLAWRIATAPPLRGQEDAAARPRWYEGVGLSLANPKAYAAMAALFSGHTLVAGRPLADGLWKAVLLIAVIFAVNAFWLWVGGALTHAMRRPASARAVNVSFAVLLIVSVLLTAAGAL